MIQRDEHPYLRKPEPYLKKTEPRGSILYALLRPYLRKGDKILDSGCGFSPLAETLIAMGYKVTGFDINAEAIAHLKNTQPLGDWWCASYEEVRPSGHTILLLLGAGAAWNGEDFHNYLVRTLMKNKIRIVFMEMADTLQEHPRDEGYKNVQDTLRERHYHEVYSGSYESGMAGPASTRTYNIFARAQMVYTPEEEAQIKDRLRQLGYMGDS